MARKPRIVVPGVAHNVGLRGNNRRRLFSSFADRLLFIRCLAHGLSKSECVLHQLTLMGNHVHLIAVPPTKDALSCLVARTCQPYAQHRNEARGGSGKLFEQRFYSKVIEDEAALMAITMYNDANGFRADLADSPFEHEWSTGPHHARLEGSRIPPRLWTPSRSYLALGATPADRAAAYRESMLAYVKRDSWTLPDGCAVEHVDDDHYTRRLERPDGVSARERALRWCPKREARR